MESSIKIVGVFAAAAALHLCRRYRKKSINRRADSLAPSLQPENVEEKPAEPVAREITSPFLSFLPRLSEEPSHPERSSEESSRLALKLNIIAGPCADMTYITEDDTIEVTIGRLGTNTFTVDDAEVSGHHLSLRWSTSHHCWKVSDLGTLNGTRLNGELISIHGRKRGREIALASDDILQLGSLSQIKVTTFPRDLLKPGSMSISGGSLPKTLTLTPKHRIPSFTSLLSPKINSTPTVRKATVAAASDELRLECCIASRTGRDHMRKGENCEDVACAECPLGHSDVVAALFCVFDGHCGRAAADAASIVLPEEVTARIASEQKRMKEGQSLEHVLRDSFLSADHRIAAEEGCTATAVLAWTDADGTVCLQTANVGDSSALFIDPKTREWKQLTEDHRLTNPRERQRLSDIGIHLASNSRRLYGLNLSRCLGDRFLKDEDLGLSAEPHISTILKLDNSVGGIILIASDGVWDVVDPAVLACTVLECDADENGTVVGVASAVVSAAVKAHTKDDVTVLAIRIWPQSEWDLRSPSRNLDDGEKASFEM